MNRTDQLKRFGMSAIPHREGGRVIFQMQEESVELDVDQARRFAFEICGAYYRAQAMAPTRRVEAVR